MTPGQPWMGRPQQQGVGQQYQQQPGQAPIDPQIERRQRLAKAILDATGGGQPQEVQHPTQAIGNAMQAIAAAQIARREKAMSPANPNPQMRPIGAGPSRPKGNMRPQPKAVTPVLGMSPTPKRPPTKPFGG